MGVVIGITGVKTAGKTTVSEMIQSYMLGAKESALANKLKNVCAEAFEVPRNDFDNQSIKEVPFTTGPKFFTKETINYILDEFGIHIGEIQLTDVFSKLRYMTLDTPRRIAQVVGTELLREFGGEDIHCDNVKIYDDGITIISDIRFPNEFNYFNNKENVKFIPLYIQRDIAEKEVDMEKSHPSETLVFTFCNKCVKIDNNGTLEKTFDQVKEVLNKEFS